MIDEAIDKLALLLQGKIPAKIDIERLEDEGHRNLGDLLNRLIVFIQEIHAIIVPLSRGELKNIKLPPHHFLASPFKELHSRLSHLTWQAKQIANGDYSQRVDFMGEFSEAFNSMIDSLDRNETLLKEKIAELEKALSRIKRLEGILPICSNCRRIRPEGADPKIQASWIQLESYITDRTEARFSHSICPECMKQLYPSFKVND